MTRSEADGSQEQNQGLPLVSFPAFAIDRRPGPVCLSLLIEHIDGQPRDKETTNSQVLIGKSITIDGLKDIR